MSDKSNGQHGMADSVSGGGGRNVTTESGTNNGGTTSTEAVRNRTESPGPGGGGPRVGQNDSVQQQFTRFADYFVICGLDLDSGLEPDLFAGKIQIRFLIQDIFLNNVKYMFRQF